MTKNLLKYYSSLLQKKFRDAENKFIAEGKRTVEEGLKNSFWKNKCETVLYTSRFREDHKDFVDEIISQTNSELITSKEFEKISDTVTPQGIAAVFSRPSDILKPEVQITSKIVVALESISDPGNLGTIIRNCDWFGIKDIVLSTECADIYNPKTIRASTGSIFHLNIYPPAELLTFFRKMKTRGYSTICADTRGENIFDYKVKDNLIIIFSSEANGPSRELLNIVDNIITIPKIGDAESLNVAGASAVILAQLTK